MKRKFIKAIVCYLTVLCLLLNNFYLFPAQLNATENLVNSMISNENSDAPTIVYSSDNGIAFEDQTPLISENIENREIVVRRSGEVSAELTITVKVYDNSAEYGRDYTLKYAGNAIEKKEGSTSVFNAFRDGGVLTSNLPIDAAEIYVAYGEADYSEAPEEVKASEMLAQIEDVGALVAEFNITFGAGEAATSIIVEMIDDEISEYSESFMLVLLGRDGNVIENTQILCQIEDNEESPSVHIGFADSSDVEANKESGVAQLEFNRSGNLATGTSALLLQNENPIGYVNFSPYQEKQVVLALPGTYRLVSDGNYTVEENTVSVKGEGNPINPIPEGADPELDNIPDEYESVPYMVQGAPSISTFPAWVSGGAVENSEYIVIMGNSENGLFTKDGSSTDGTLSFDSAKNMYKLNTEGGASQGYLFSRTNRMYNLNGIKSIEGSVYIDDLTTGYCDVIFGVWNKGHDKIYTNDNKSTQNLKFDISVGMGSQYIYYCNSDLKGAWDCGWNAYTPNGFKLNKRAYDIFIMQPEALDYCGSSFAPTLSAGSNKMTYTMGKDQKINISYVTDSAHPARLIGYKLFNGKTMQYSELISLSDSQITFNQSFLDKHDSKWAYDSVDTEGNPIRTFTILPVFEKIEVDISVRESSFGSISIESPAANPCKGDTLVFKGQGITGYPFSGVFYQCRKSAGGEVLEHGVAFKVGDTVTYKLDGNYGHYTFQGVFSVDSDKLSVNYADQTHNGKLELNPGVVLSGKDYVLSDYFPLMATPDEGFITVWESSSNYYFGDIFHYQLDGNYLNNSLSVKFLKEGDYIDPNDLSSKISLSTGKISGRLTRNDMNLFDGTTTDIPLKNTMYTIKTSHGVYEGFTDENGYYTIDNFTAVLGGTYSMAVSYQDRIGYITFEYNGAGSDYNLSLPQFAVGGFYPVEVTATVSGQGYGSNTLNLTSAGTVQIAAKIYVHSSEYKITGVNFHFLSTLNSNYGHELKVLNAVRNENANVGDKYEMWTLDLSETSAVPEDTQIYVTVTAEYTSDTGLKVPSSTDLVNSGYCVELALNEDTVPIHQDIPEVPGVQSGNTDASVFEVPIIGTLDMSFTSKTGGYFVQQGSWKEAGDVYTLVCGHSIQPNFLAGTLKTKYQGAVATRDLLDSAASGNPKGISDLKQKSAAQFEVAPIFMLKFTVKTVENGSGELIHNLAGFEFAIGLDAFVTKNVPFNVSGVPCYVFVSLSAEAYFQMQFEMPDNTGLGSDVNDVIKDLNEQAETDINAFVAAPMINFGVKGGVGWNAWASIFAEGSISAPFIIGFTPLDAAGTISVDVGIGADLMMFTAKISHKFDIGSYGSENLYNDLTTIQGYKNINSSYKLKSGASYDTFDDAINNATFSMMARPKASGNILQSGPVTQTVLAQNVFKNTNIQLVQLKSGKIMALFLTDNHAPDGSFNYLSVAYAISEDNGKTWSQVEYVDKNIDTAATSLQYDINVFELEDRILVTWSEADLDSLLQNVDPTNLSAAQIAKLINAMNLKGRFFDMSSGEPIDEAFVIAENSAVFCGALDAVQNGENVYVYYQRNALVTSKDTTIEDLLNADRTIAMATAKINDTDNWKSVPVRAMSEEGGQYRITEVAPFVHDGILGEVIVIDRNGRLMSYSHETNKMEPDIEDRQLYLRTYHFDENGNPETTSIIPLTDAVDCAQSPQVASNEDYLYLFWNHNGEIVYASDFVARENDDELTRAKAVVTVDSNDKATVINNNKFAPSSIDGDESLHFGSKFTVSMTDGGRVLICWVGNNTEDETLVPTDEIYGIMLETKLVSEVVANLANVPASESDEEYQLWAAGSPVALTDENRPIGAVDSICFESSEESKFLLVYTRLNNILRNESTAADILAVTGVDRPELSAKVDFVKYPMPGEKEKAYITVYNDGFQSLCGYNIKISGIGEEITLEVENTILPGRLDEICVEISVPENFNSGATLKVEITGLGEQSEYTAEAQTEVLYGSYFVPTDIPKVDAVPNSDDCIIKVHVKNLGNAEGTPEFEFFNRIYASSSEDDAIVYEYISDVVITPNGEATITYTMADTLIGRGEYSTVQVRLGDKYDQATEAPMPNKVELTVEDLAYDQQEPETPDEPEVPDEPTQTPETGDKKTVLVLAVVSMVVICSSVCLYRKRKYVR